MFYKQFQIPSSNSGRGSFASALRSLAKQAEIKDDEPTDQRAPSAGTSGSNSAANNMHMQQQRPSNSAENRNVESAVAMDNRQKRKANSPPPEKVFFLVFRFVT